MGADAEKLDLVVQWPRRTPIERLTAMRTVPVYANPKHLDPEGGTVWIASGGHLVAHFRVESISRPQRVTLLSGASAAKGRRLRVDDGTLRILDRPKQLTRIPVEPGASRNPGRVDGFVYLKR